MRGERREEKTERSYRISGGINWLLSAAHRCTIVITAEYVNRRVKSEFNIIINSGDVIALKYTPGFNSAFMGKCGQMFCRLVIVNLIRVYIA